MVVGTILAILPSAVACCGAQKGDFMIRLSLAFAMCGFVASCSSGGGPAKTTQSVGTSGGQVTGSDGTSLTVPAGAVTTDTTFTIETAKNAAAPTGAAAVAAIYAFGPEGAQFAKPVTVTLPIDTSLLPAGKTAADVKIYTAPTGSTTYTVLETVVVDATHVRAATSHFSVFAPAVQSGPVDTGHADMTMPVDMAMGGTSGCTPVCTSSTSGAGKCGCTSTCGGVMYVMSCTSTAPNGPASCYCEKGGQTSGSATLDSGCNASTTLLQQAFGTQCKFLPN